MSPADAAATGSGDTAGDGGSGSTAATSSIVAETGSGSTVAGDTAGDAAVPTLNCAPGCSARASRNPVVPGSLKRDQLFVGRAHRKAETHSACVLSGQLH